jgi:hypothetical protein
MYPRFTDDRAGDCVSDEGAFVFSAVDMVQQGSEAWDARFPFSLVAGWKRRREGWCRSWEE